MRQIIGSVQAQLSSLESQVDAERKCKAEMHAQVAALQTDNSLKEAQIESLVKRVEQHAVQLHDSCVNTPKVEKSGGGRRGDQTAAEICEVKGHQVKEMWSGYSGETRTRCTGRSTAVGYRPAAGDVRPLAAQAVG